MLISTDMGETWEWINGGFSNPNVYGLTLSPNGYLYAYGRHIHRSASPVTTSGLNSLALDQSFTLFPNPCTNRVTIELSETTDHSQERIISIYALSGKEVYSQIHRFSSTIILPLNTLEPGVYLLTVQTGRNIVTKQIIKT